MTRQKVVVIVAAGHITPNLMISLLEKASKEVELDVEIQVKSEDKVRGTKGTIISLDDCPIEPSFYYEPRNKAQWKSEVNKKYRRKG